MLLDNQNRNKKVHESLSSYANDAILDIGTNYFTVGKNGVEKSPILIISKQNQQSFLNFIDEIIELKKNKEDTTILETQLDNMIYELYSLSDDEVDSVQGKL